MKSSQNPQNQVISRIYGHQRGWVFTPNDFRHVGTPQAVGNALRRLVKQGLIVRLSRGLYQYPVKHPTIGIISPSPDAVARALVGGAGARLLPSGAYAANLIGLSNQVPAKITFLTDAPSKTVRLGRQIIQLKHAGTRKMSAAGKPTAVILQALRFLGRRNIDEKVIAGLRLRLTEAEKTALMKDAKFAPVWLSAIVQKIASSP